MEIAGKAAGTYFVVTDNSAVPTYTPPSKLRVAFINSQTGPVNSAVFFAQGDATNFTKVFGRGNRKLEKGGNFSHKECLLMLNGGPLCVINLRTFNENDIVGINGMSANHSTQETKTTMYSDVFNTNTLWYPTPKNIVEKLTNENLVNFANIGVVDKSIFVVMSDKAETLTNEFDVRLSNSELAIGDYPALSSNLELKVSDTIVDVYIFDTVFEASTASTNPYYGHLFNVGGMIDYSKLEELSLIPEAGFNRVVSGSLIPDLINENNEPISIDVKLNNVFAQTGIVCYLNDDVLENETLNDLPVLNTSGVYNYNPDGTLTEAGSMLSHRQQVVIPADIQMVDLNAITDADVVSMSDKQLVEYTNPFGLGAGDNQVFGIWEQGIKVGDKIMFETATTPSGKAYSTVKLIELVDEIAPGTKTLVTRSKPTMVLTSVASGSIKIAIDFTATSFTSSDIIRIYRKLATQPNEAYTVVHNISLPGSTPTYDFTDLTPLDGTEYIYYVGLVDNVDIATKQSVNSISKLIETEDTESTAGAIHDIADGPITTPYLKSWKKVKLTLEDKYPTDITSYQRVLKIAQNAKIPCAPTNLVSYKPRVDQFTNGTAVRQNEILDVMLSKSITKGLKNVDNIRYFVDCFKSFVETGYKYQFAQLADSLDKSNKFVRCIVNEPFIEDLEKSTDPLFRDSFGGAFDIKYIATGGNSNLSIKTLSKPVIGNYMSYYYGSEYDGRNETITAGKVSNLYINKTFDFDVVANETGVINITGLALSPDENERKAMEDFRWNPFIKIGSDFRIYGNLSGQKKNTGLTQIHNSELLCFIKNTLFNMSRGEAFKKGLYNEYLSTETEVTSFMENLVLQGAVQPNPVVICNASNNTSEISKQRIKLIHIEYTQVDSLDKVVFDLELK